ncbi:MAG: hypothetical protein K8W52_11030 [Deltaproteobacteria bacterium]|nr:hypothetical protein [Deltaproteobacteria bacterium]
MHLKTIWLVAVLVSTLACGATMGRKINTAKVDDIRMCVTSEQDLLSWFGEPYQRGNQSGFPTLQWGYAHAGLGGGESQSLIVYLNADRKVVDFQLNPTGALATVTDRCAPPPAPAPAP